MKSFWEDAYDDGKDRRYGMLFFSTLLAIFISLGLIAIFCGVAEAFPTELGAAMLVTVVIFISVLCISIWRWARGRNRREEQAKYASLSRDELFKARSKLKNSTKPVVFRIEQRPPKQAPPQRKPDTYLKY